MKLPGLRFALTLLLLIVTTQPCEAGWGSWFPFPDDLDGPGNVVILQDPSQNTFAFRRTSNLSIHWKQHSGDSWTEWSMIPWSGGSLVDPAAASYSGSGLFVFTVMAAAARPSGVGPPETFMFPKGKAIYMKQGYFSDFTPWIKVPGMTTSDSPAAIEYRRRLYLFVRDPDGAIQFNTYRRIDDTGEWGGWSEVPLGGFRALGSPAVVVDDLKLYIFARNASDATIHMTAFNGLCWSGWRQVPGSGEIPGTSAVSPAAVKVPSLDVVHLFVAGIGDRKIYQNVLDHNDEGVDWSDSDWSGWFLVSGPRTTSTRLATSASGNQTNLFVLDDTDQVIYVNNYQP